MKELGNINDILGYLLLKITNKKLDKQKVLFNYFNKS